jgi:hypothetical protein
LRSLSNSAPRKLRQHELLIQIHGHHPLQPVPPRERFLPVMMHAPHKERAYRALRQTGGVHGDASPLPLLAQRTTQTAHRFADGAVNGLVVETLQKTIQRREVRHTHKPQHLAQFAMLAIRRDISFRERRLEARVPRIQLTLRPWPIGGPRR